MKNGIRIWVIVVFCCFVSNVFASDGDMGGTGCDGSADKPYLIEDFADFQAFCNDANYWAEGIYTELKCDLDLDPNLEGREIYTQAPIAGDSNATSFPPKFDGTVFAGSFDGNGHVISNLTINGADYCGLFGFIGSKIYSPGSNFPISNLGLENVLIICTGSYIGALAGLNGSGSIMNSHSTGIVTGDDGVGGLVGGSYCSSSITDSYSTCSVVGRDWVGGLAASISSGGSIVDSYATGEVNGRRTAGGFVGSNGGSIVNCYSTGDVNCLWGEAGGITGWNNGKATIASAYSTGDVTAGGCYVGGIVGWNEGSVMLSYSRGAVTGNSVVGGITGENRGSIASSCATGAITASGGDGAMVGGIAGWWGYSESVTSSFWDIETCGINVSHGGIGKTTAEMKDMVTFINAGWDFVGESSNGTSETWQMSATDGYPVLSIFDGYIPVALAGQGSEDDPYLIGNAAELGAVFHYNNNACFKLGSDIDLNDIEWSMGVVPVFGGCFDGNDCVIYNLNIEGGGELGLFGVAVNAAEVSNVALENVSITGIGKYVGSLVGRNDYGNVTSSCSSGVVTGKVHVGGLVGRNDSLVESSCSMCAIIGSSSGGLVGENEGHVMNSYSTGDVTGGGSGGLVGHNYNKVANSYSTGAVTGDSSVGGLVGVNHDRVMSSYSTGVVTGNKYVGGLVGSNYGCDNGNVTSSFWDVESSGIPDSFGGIGKTTAEMKMVSTFLDAGWDLISVWNIEDGQICPLLRKYSAFDTNYDNKVNFIDFAEFANRWLEIAE